MAAVAQRLGYSYHSKSLRKSFCITSYFRKPDQGVHDWEELSRSSAFLVSSSHSSKKYHVISAAHVTHPFLFPRLYPEEFPRFLSFLREDDVKVALQFRELETGKLLSEFDLRRKYMVKQESDLVVGHLDDENRFEDIMQNKFGVKVEALQLRRDVPDLSASVELVGHDFSFNANGHHVLVPVSLPGTILGGNSRRIVVDTPQPSVMGLCGGPVLESANEGDSSFVIGMVEGRIQNALSDPSLSQTVKDGDADMHKALADRTVLLSSVDIAQFVALVEEDLDELANESKYGGEFMQMPGFMPPPTAQPQAPESAPEMHVWDGKAVAKDDDIDF